MDTILIDSDVCLDFITGRQPWNAEAVQIFDACEHGLISAYISGLTYSNLFYLLRKYHGAGKTVTMLSDLRKFTQVSPIIETVVDWSLSSGWTDFEDALQYQSAVESGCDAVVSRNLSDYKLVPRLPVLSPTDFISNHL